MKLLFGQNLSFKLVRRLADVYPGSDHVRLLGLDQTDDQEIWKFAAREGFAIVSKDADSAACDAARPSSKARLDSPWELPADAVEALLRQGLPAVAEFPADPGLAVLALPVQLIR